MKKLIVLLLLLSYIKSQGQAPEFKEYSNGLIYSEYAMSQLSKVADSLNLQFRICDFNKQFFAKEQTVAHFVDVNSGDVQQALKDLKNNLDFEAFLKKHPEIRVKKNILVVKSNYTNYEDEKTIEFREIDMKNGSGYTFTFTKDLEKYGQNLKGKWVINYIAESEYWDESVRAFYFPNGFISQQLPDHYAKMVGYADCMIDTTAVKFKKSSELGSAEVPKNWHKLSHSEKEGLLDRLRGIKVYGMCSMDDSPRIHAVNIALLSAETLNWKIFLRSHMDILNDNFERASDGSYAYARRKTYIKELETLDINASDLIFGISLRVENPAQNHYYGSISRIGRAISESQNKDDIENQILEMIKDSALDDYNRVLAFFMYLNYNYYLEDEKIKQKNRDKLGEAIAYLPTYLKDKVVLDKE